MFNVNKKSLIVPGCCEPRMAPKKINVLTQLVFTVYPITQNKSSSMYRSAN